MPPKRRRLLPYTFPHKIVFVISFVLCLCACGSIVNSVIAWNNRLWGYYIGTGLWSGIVVLLAGMFGIVASYVRNICTVKTFMIISIFGCLVSLGMVALAAGGLDPQSGFYDGINRTTFMTHVNHSVYLGLGVLQLTLCVLSDGICTYYLFIERNAQLYRVKDSDTQKRKKLSSDIQREGKYRSSTGSEVPLVGGESTANSSKRKHKDKKCKSRSSETTDGDVNIEGDLPIPYTATGSLDRPTLRRQEKSWSKASPVPNLYTRSASFSTFGHSHTPDRVSLIVHPTDDNASVAETIVSSTQCKTDTECHYAQTLLFGPPMPIDENDQLPPYEAVDNQLYRKVNRRRIKRPNGEELNLSTSKSYRTNNAASYGKGKSDTRNRSSQTRSKIPTDRKEIATESDTEKKNVFKLSDNVGVIARLSRSADLLAFENESKDRKLSHRHSSIHEQGISFQDFTHSSEMILVSDQTIQLRHKRPQTQSLKVNREKRLDRRRKALSAEVKLNKDQLIAHERMVNNENRLERRTNSIDGSNSSLFASNRIMPTKFSLRTPVRQIGMPHACSPVPVKPIVTLPLVSPPPKPPRNYSVTAEDLNVLNTDIDGDVENVFADINDLNNIKDDDVFATEVSSSTVDVNRDNIPGDTKHKTSKIAIVQASPIHKSDNSDKNVIPRSVHLDTNTGSTIISPDIKLDSGPVLNYVPPNREAGLRVDHMDGLNNKDDVKSDLVSVEKSKLEIKPHTDTMVVPTSPIMVPPSVLSLKANKSNTTVDVNAHKSNPVVNSARNSQPSGTAKNIQKDSESNDTEVVHENVMENATASPISPISSTSLNSPTSPASPTSPTSPTSLTSPTSPTAKVQKAIRLLYTFKDQHVSVFDPLGNGKEIEEHIVVTVAETLSVEHPVESPVETVQVKMNNEQPYSEKAIARIDSLSNLRVRVPPMSPSERILQRKAIKLEGQKAVSLSKEDRPVIIQPTHELKNSRSATGARPKSSYRGLFDPLSAPPKHVLFAEEPANMQPYVNKENKSYTKPIKADNPVSDISVHSSSPTYTSDYPQRNFIRSQSLAVTTTAHSSTPIPSPRSVKSPLTNLSTSNNVTKSNRISDNSVQFAPSSPHSVETSDVARDVPVNRVQAISMTQSVPSNSPRASNSQGVLHLPQSQYSRQVSNHIPPPTSAAENYGQVVGPPPNGSIVQNNAHQHNNNQLDQPLFSVVL